MIPTWFALYEQAVFDLDRAIRLRDDHPPGSDPHPDEQARAGVIRARLQTIQRAMTRPTSPSQVAAVAWSAFRVRLRREAARMWEWRSELEWLGDVCDGLVTWHLEGASDG